MQLGQVGIWRRRTEGHDDLAELEALGYTAFWVGFSPSLPQAREFLERSSTLTIATGILNVWQHEPAAVAAEHADLVRDFPDRFLLGIGVGHPEATAEYQAPLAKMRAFFDGLDRLIDAVIPHGTPEQISEVVRAHLDAGADHVCLQPVGHGHAPLGDYRALASALF